MILKNKNIALNISNIVTANQCANVVLAAGASPIMSTSWKDINDLLHIAHSLTINIGTTNEAEEALIVNTVKKAQALQIPIILDPVGCGASKFRTNLAQQIAGIGVSIIRGNASEILALRFNTATKGVDNQTWPNNLHQLQEIASNMQTVLLVTGARDFIINGDNVITIEGGHQNMTLKTGMGCLLSALVGALATELPLVKAAILGATIMKKAGEKLFRNKLASYSAIYNFIFKYE